MLVLTRRPNQSIVIGDNVPTVYAELGKIIVDPRFAQVDTNTYRSPDYDTAAERIEIFAHSGAGNVSITTW